MTPQDTTHPECDGHYEDAGYDTAECVVTDEVVAVGADGVEEGTVGNEEEDEGTDDALRCTQRKHLLVEQQVVVTRRVQLGVAQREVFIEVLSHRHRTLVVTDTAL